MDDIDPVRRLLRESGCEDHVVQAGLAGLVEAWEKAVAQVEAGYPLGLDDYLNDMDGRQILVAALDQAGGPAAEAALANRVRAADTRMRKVVRQVDECLWGDPVADAEGWTPDENWWYFSLPRAPGPELREDLERG
jgi:hypothetical protein